MSESGQERTFGGLSVAKKTVENFVARAIRLYEQEPGEASRLRPAWVACAAVGQVGRRSSARAVSEDNQPPSARPGLLLSAGYLAAGNGPKNEGSVIPDKTTY